MQLPHNEYLIYKRALLELEDVVPSSPDVCYITINKYGLIEEHDDELFDEGPHWFCYGTTKPVGVFDEEMDELLPDGVWRLLRRRVEP